MKKKVVLIISSEQFHSHEEWKTYQCSIERQIKVQNKEIETLFHHHRMNPKKGLMQSLSQAPAIIFFKECPVGTIKTVHSKVSRIHKKTSFCAMNFGVTNHGIDGVTTIDSVGNISFFLTTEPA